MGPGVRVTLSGVDVTLMFRVVTVLMLMFVPLNKAPEAMVKPPPLDVNGPVPTTGPFRVIESVLPEAVV